MDNSKSKIAKDVGLFALVSGAILGGCKVVKKLLNSNTAKQVIDDVKNTVTTKGKEVILDEKGKVVPKENFVNAAFERIKQFPELLSQKEEIQRLDKITVEKARKKLFDIDYYKDLFRLDTTIAADQLKIVREATDPKLRAIFDSDRSMFHINDGIMIHGSDRPEKKELLNYFIEEAKKHDIDVVHVQAGDIDPNVFNQTIHEIFPKAKEKFLKERKHTMIVIEDIDKMLNNKDVTLSVPNSSARGTMNLVTHKCGEHGVIWISTAKDLSKLDESSTRGGRITHKIDIDKALELSNKTSE